MFHKNIKTLQWLSCSPAHLVLRCWTLPPKDKMWNIIKQWDVKANKNTCPLSRTHAPPYTLMHIHWTPEVLNLIQYLLSKQITNSIQLEHHFLSLLRQFSFLGHDCSFAGLKCMGSQSKTFPRDLLNHLKKPPLHSWLFPLVVRGNLCYLWKLTFTSPLEKTYILGLSQDFTL